MGTSALRRLVAEYKQILKNSPDGIIAGPGKILLFLYYTLFDFLTLEKNLLQLKKKIILNGKLRLLVQKEQFLKMEYSLLV